MSTLKYIGINEASAKLINSRLNGLLADLQVFYANVRGFHWNIEGHLFFTLHPKFEELYNYLADRIDEVAERILVLGGKPESSFSQYLKTSSIKESSDITCDEVAVQHILDAFKTLLEKERDLMDVTDEANDVGTNDLINEFIDAQEKMVWMYDAFLTNGCRTK